MINLSFSQSSIIQRSLFSTNNSLATAMQRLSTGCRINSAADDAAGLSLSTKLTSSISGLNVANQNTQNGISFLHIADGALSTMSKDVQRMRDLAVQAANGVYSNNERAMLNNEAQQRLEGIKQAINSTSFADKKIFSNETTSSQMTEAAAIAAGYTVIKTAAEFVANIPQNGAGTAGQTYILMGDIDMSSVTNYTAKTNFAGTFDGNGYTISNLTINKPAVTNQGLFGTTNNGSKFQNVTLNNFNITGNSYTGALVGFNNTTISIYNVKVNNSNITGVNYTGGIIGFAGNSCIINDSKITNSTIQGQKDVGGIIGYSNNISMSNCHSSANISATFDEVGGLVGEIYSGGSITKSSASGSISGNGAVGGLLGRNNGWSPLTITESTSSASVTSTTNNNSTGGFIGSAGEDLLNLTIQNCYSTGSVTNGSGFIGGTFEGTVNISNCYATGTVTGAGQGGFANQLYSSVLQNNFWNTETSGKATGVGNGNMAGITGKTTVQMADSSTFTSAGFSDSVWDFSSSSGPQLDWQMPSTESNSTTDLQIGAYGDTNSRLTVNTGFSIGDFAIDLSTAQAARNSIDLCDKLLNSITNKQSSIGASTNKLQSILTSNSFRIENLSGAKSVISDADIAKETAQMIRNQILKQTGITMLSNYKDSNAQLLLSLLK